LCIHENRRREYRGGERRWNGGEGWEDMKCGI
jgi:hypothetical protein